MNPIRMGATEFDLKSNSMTHGTTDSHSLIMKTSSNGNLFRVTGHLYGEFTGHRWSPRTKASDAELWCFFFICAWINGWINNREAGDLRRHRAHYDVIVMCLHSEPVFLSSADSSHVWCCYLQYNFLMGSSTISLFTTPEIVLVIQNSNDRLAWWNWCITSPCVMMYVSNPNTTVHLVCNHYCSFIVIRNRISIFF